MKKNIPLYDITLTDDSVGMYAIALVDLPAVESELFMFEKHNVQEPQLFQLADASEHCILSCVIRTDFPIYRKDDDGYEYYIQFSKEIAKQIVQRFFKNGFQCNVDLNHNHDLWVNEDIELREMFIKDSEKGINPKGFENIAEGSVFAVYQIKNQQLWNEIENGSFKGLSLEGMFKPVKVEENEKEIANLEELVDFLRNFNN